MQLYLLGFIVGMISAGIGVGGGAIMIPLLVSFFRFDFHKAASTSLATIIPISLVGATSYLLLDNYHVPLQYFFTLIPSTIAGAIIGGYFIKNFKVKYLKLAFAIFILIAGIRMLGLYDFLSSFFVLLSETSQLTSTILIVFFGILTGVISILLGVGCGLIIVPFFVILIGLDIHAAITLSLTTMFFLTLTACIVRKKHRKLSVSAIRKTIPSALIGSIVGILISNYLPSLVLKKVFAVFLILMSFKFLFDEIRVSLSSFNRSTQNEL